MPRFNKSLLLICCVISFNSTPILAQQMVEVPRLIGVNYQEALELLANAKLKKGAVNYISNGCAYEKDDVASQKPLAGDMVKKNTKVSMIVNDEDQVIVPLLDGLTIEEADKTLSELGLIGYHGYKNSDNMPSGATCCQAKQTGTTIYKIISDTSPKHSENMACQEDKTKVVTFRTKYTSYECIEPLRPGPAGCH